METPTDTEQMMLDSLDQPVEWMDMARTLRRAADLLERRVLEAVREEHTVSQRRQSGEPNSPEDIARERQASKDQGLARVAQMLYQLSYENAAKAIIRLEGIPAPKIHNLVELFKIAGVQVVGIESAHAEYLTRLNQLGRYRFNEPSDKKKRQGATVDYGTAWTTQFDECRSAIDDAIASTWIEKGGDSYWAKLVEPD